MQTRRLTIGEDRSVPQTIARAASEGWTSLSLAGRGISALPESTGQLKALRALDLSNNRLSFLPESIGNLRELRILSLSDNQLTSLPESIGQLKNLRKLAVWANALSYVPESIGKLASLESLILSANTLKNLPEISTADLLNLRLLDLEYNRIAFLPDWIGRLSRLEILYLGHNRLTCLPDSIALLDNLESLDLSNNRLSSLPESIGNLSELKSFSIANNYLADLPESFTQLVKLQLLDITGNPVDPLLLTTSEAGIQNLFAYLDSVTEAAGREKLFEAKLILVGEGGVGKTTLLKALTGKEPRQDEQTTHGVDIDIEALELPHPHEHDVSIRLNTWDFGGQEVHRVTHQFFFSRRSIYLLVWEPRRGVQQCQVEDWLKLIRLRVGQTARVIVVSTHCRTGERIARIDIPVLTREFPMIIDFCEVDSSLLSKLARI